MAVAVGVIAVGVLVVAQSTFSQLMVQAGQSADTARSMFDHSVVVVFAVATVMAAVVGVALATLLGLRLAAPLRQVAAAARRVARGDYGARVERSGPEEMTSLDRHLSLKALGYSSACQACFQSGRRWISWLRCWAIYYRMRPATRRPAEQ